MCQNIHELDSGVMVLRESRKAEHGLFTLGLQRLSISNNSITKNFRHKFSASTFCLMNSGRWPLKTLLGKSEHPSTNSD